MPELAVTETPFGCRLSLHDQVHAEGPDLQTAADYLVAKVLDAACALRNCGTHFRPLFAPADEEWIKYLHDLAAVAAQGGDVRACVLY
jgi:hypothetical protein